MTQVSPVCGQCGLRCTSVLPLFWYIVHTRVVHGFIWSVMENEPWSWRGEVNQHSTGRYDFLIICQIQYHMIRAHTHSMWANNGKCGNTVIPYWIHIIIIIIGENLCSVDILLYIIYSKCFVFVRCMGKNNYFIINAGLSFKEMHTLILP